MESQPYSQDGSGARGAGSRASRRRTFRRWAKGLAVVACAWVAFWATMDVGVWHSGKEEAAIGVVTYRGLPFPWIETAPGLAWGIGHFWVLPINLAVWTAGSCLAWRVKTWRGIAWGLAVAELPVLPFVLLIYC